MQTKLFGVLGKYGGLAGLAIGMFLILFQGIIQTPLRNQFHLEPHESYLLIRSFMVLTFGLAGIGVIAWLMTKGLPPRTPVPTSFVASQTILVAMVLATTAYVGTLPTETRVEVPPKIDTQAQLTIQQQIQPQPRIQRDFLVCVGQYPDRCPKGSVVLDCGSSIENWARTVCTSFKAVKLSDTSGNRCGYYIANVSCEK